MDTLTEKRLQAIEAANARHDYRNEDLDCEGPIDELVAEVRRLRAKLKAAKVEADVAQIAITANLACVREALK